MPKITDPKIEAAEDDLGRYRAELLSDAGGLTQFGAFKETIWPGSRSSRPHWHAHEDEMIYVLEGEVTLHEGDGVSTLRPHDSATFKANVAVGHCLENRTDVPVTYLVIGTRSGADVVTYTDNGDVLTVADGVNTLRDKHGAVLSTKPYHGAT